MRKIIPVLFLCLLFLAPASAHAKTEVLEGDAAKALLAEQKDSAQVLAQLNKMFVLRVPGQEEQKSPKEITLEAGSYLFIANEEDMTVHNVYDTTDQSWVLKKQLPSGIAAIKFMEPGDHELRCAIHPAMKIKINVIEKSTGQ